MFGTSPAEGMGSTGQEVDIESLLAQFASEPGFDLDALFASAGVDTQGGGDQGVMDLLSTWQGAETASTVKEGTG